MFAGQGVNDQCQSRMNCRLYSIVLVQSYATVFCQQSLWSCSAIHMQQSSMRVWSDLRHAPADRTPCDMFSHVLTLIPSPKRRCQKIKFTACSLKDLLGLKDVAFFISSLICGPVKPNWKITMNWESLRGSCSTSALQYCPSTDDIVRGVARCDICDTLGKDKALIFHD